MLPLSISDLTSWRVIADSTLVVSSGSIQILLSPEPRRLAASRRWLFRLTSLLSPHQLRLSRAPPSSRAQRFPLFLPLSRLASLEFGFPSNLKALQRLALPS